MVVTVWAGAKAAAHSTTAVASSVARIKDFKEVRGNPAVLPDAMTILLGSETLPLGCAEGVGRTRLGTVHHVSQAPQDETNCIVYGRFWEIWLFLATSFGLCEPAATQGFGRDAG